MPLVVFADRLHTNLLGPLIAALTFPSLQASPYGWLLLAGIAASLFTWTRLARRDHRLVLIYVAALLILVRCQVETNYPGPGGQTAKTGGVGRQAGQASLKLRDHRLHGIKDAIGKLLFSQFIPDVLLRIEFR